MAIESSQFDGLEIFPSMNCGHGYPHLVLIILNKILIEGLSRWKTHFEVGLCVSASGTAVELIFDTIVPDYTVDCINSDDAQTARRGDWP